MVSVLPEKEEKKISVPILPEKVEEKIVVPILPEKIEEKIAIPILLEKEEEQITVPVLPVKEEEKIVVPVLTGIYKLIFIIFIITPSNNIITYNKMLFLKKSCHWVATNDVTHQILSS